MAETAYYLSRAEDWAPEGPVACRSARWDPNSAGCAAVAQEDGVLRYLRPAAEGGGEQCFRLYTTVTPLAVGGGPPPPVRTPWALWSFVPGRPRLVLFVHRNSHQLLQTTVPLGAAAPAGDAPSVAAAPVWLVRELRHESAITALAVSACGEYVAVGYRDGTVAHWRLPLSLSLSDDEATPATVAPQAHRGPVTALTLLSAHVPERGLRSILVASGGVDQRLCVWDAAAPPPPAGAAAPAPLHRLLCANPAAVSCATLALLPPPLCASLGVEIGVLLMAGASDGGVQARPPAPPPTPPPHPPGSSRPAPPRAAPARALRSAGADAPSRAPRRFGPCSPPHPPSCSPRGATACTPPCCRWTSAASPTRASRAARTASSP